MPSLKITKANLKEIVKPTAGQVDYFDPHPDRQPKVETITVADPHRQYMSTKKTLASVAA